MTVTGGKWLGYLPHSVRVGFFVDQSGRGDLNPGPHGPDPCALAELRYAPKVLLLYSIRAVWQAAFQFESWQAELDTLGFLR